MLTNLKDQPDETYSDDPHGLTLGTNQTRCCDLKIQYESN